MREISGARKNFRALDGFVRALRRRYLVIFAVLFFTGEASAGKKIYGEFMGSIVEITRIIFAIWICGAVD